MNHGSFASLHRLFVIEDSNANMNVQHARIYYEPN